MAKTLRQGLWGGALLALALTGVGWAQGSSYRLGPKDLIEVRVFEEPTLNGSHRVAEDGSIQMPLIGRVEVAGLTTADLNRDLASRLEENYLQRATVTVELLELRSKPISVIGAVERPGNIEIRGRLTLLEALTAAGGLLADHGDFLQVVRTADNGLTAQLEIDVDGLLSGRDPSANIPIFPNDLIRVPTETLVTVYFLGEVGQAGAVEFPRSQRVTLLTAIARIGGLGDRASKKITIKRRRSDGTLVEVEVNYKRVLNGADPDPTLEDGDLVVVKESFF